MKPGSSLSRRAALKNLGIAVASAAAFSTHSVASAETAVSRSGNPSSSSNARRLIAEGVFQSPLIDTHEHLIEEKERWRGTGAARVACDDWALLFSHYLNSDLAVAGMPKEEMERFLSPKVDPEGKWPLLEPYWRAVKHTGYAQAARSAVRQLYGVEELSAKTIRKVQEGYEKTRQPGFYRRLLQDQARIESCQVKCLTGEPFKESDQPLLLMQDISIVGMFAGPNLNQISKNTS